MTKRWFALAAAVLTASASGCATAAPQVVERVVPAAPAPCLVSAPNNTNPAFTVDVWSPEKTPFRVGQDLALNMRSAAPAYLSLFHVSSSCKATQLVANKQVGAGDTASFPEGGLRATIKPPGGKEYYILVATTQQLDWRTGSDSLGDGAVSSLDMTPQQMVGRLNQTLARLAPNAWSTRTLTVQILEN